MARHRDDQTNQVAVWRHGWWLTAVGAVLWPIVQEISHRQWFTGSALTLSWFAQPLGRVLVATGLVIVFVRTTDRTARVFAVIGVIGLLTRAACELAALYLTDLPKASPASLVLDGGFSLATQLISIGTIGAGIALWSHRWVALPLCLSGFTLQLFLGPAWLAAEYLHEPRPYQLVNAAMALFYLWFAFALRRGLTRQ